MRRDICHTYDAPVGAVYAAYITAIKTVFKKEAERLDSRTLSFGLNMSFRYNMNGGACTVHFMPHGRGTAVDVRYSIAQLAGARYGAHCDAMTAEVSRLLATPAIPANLDVELFLAEQQSPTKEVFVPTPEANPKPMVEAKPTVETKTTSYSSAGKLFKFCTGCGLKIDIADRFCVRCGKPQS